MSETEEPPTKVQKFELSSDKGKDDEIDEGQEEWLSEELTDDDILPQSQERSDADNTCDDSTLPSINDSAEQNNLTANDTKSNADQQIEQTLDNLENSTMDLPDELGSFLVRKSVPVQKSKLQDTVKQSEEDDGNDTDDLLRMLGEDDKNKKKQVLKSIKERSKARDEDSVSSDDEIIYEKPKKMSVKTAGMKQATKALPEDMSTECESSDDEGTMKKMFSSNSRQSVRQQKQKQQNNKSSTNATKSAAKTATNTTKTVAQIRQLNKVAPKTPTPVKQYPRKATAKPKDSTSELKSKKDEKKQTDYQEIRAEFLEDGEIDLNDDFTNHTDEEGKSRNKQGLMKPERMDEEVPSDDESKSGGESLYDDFPSSASEDDFDDWFHLDIRSESAGEFLPLLGSKAYDLLNEEKKRVEAKIASLKDSLASIVENSKVQSEEVNKATLTLADLDALLTAS